MAAPALFGLMKVNGKTAGGEGFKGHNRLCARGNGLLEIVAVQMNPYCLVGAPVQPYAGALSNADTLSGRFRSRPNICKSNSAAVRSPATMLVDTIARHSAGSRRLKAVTPPRASSGSRALAARCARAA